MKIIKYQLATEINHGSREEPDIETVLADVSITCPNDKLEANLAIAEEEAYHGKVSVEEAGPEPEPSGLEDRVTNLETAIADGLNLYKGDLGNG